MVIESRTVVAFGGRIGRNEPSGLSGVMKRSFISIEEVVTWVYTFVKRDQSVHVRSAHFTVYKLNLSK